MSTGSRASRAPADSSPGDVRQPPWLAIELPWRGVDRAGEALELRLAEPRDATAWVDHLQRITSDTPWMLQSEQDPLPSTLELRSLLEEYAAREGSVAICAVRPGDRTIRGSLTLANGRSRRTEHAAELSMGAGRTWWGRGIGALLMGAGLTWASRNPILERVSLSVFQDNEVARRLYEKVGFATEGVLRRYVRFPPDVAQAPRGDGPRTAHRYEDLVVMGLWLRGDR